MVPEFLIQACAAGDPTAWERFVKEFRPWLLQVAARCAASEAEDVVSELFRLLLEKDRALLKSFRPPYQLRAWLSVLVRRVANRHLRRKRPQSGVPEEAEAPAAKPTVPIRELLAELPVEDRVLLLMFYEDNASYEEISAVTGIPVNTLGKRKFRAVRALGDIARKKGFDWLPGSGPPKA
ncbi:MAG TPA: sigma-70 family RNA polymerase sigma factor [Planctomycetota bacterium]|nr:sigma-70 family RNA polymerase sigma factor [Planctomycetota bacterium]